MVLRAHREPGMDDRVPTMAQVFRMATSGGGKTTPYAAEIGTLEIAKAADMVLHDWKQISYPYLDPEDARARRGYPTGQSGGRAERDDSRRNRLSGRQVHPPRPRRRPAPTFRDPEATAERRGNRAPPLGEGGVSPRQGVLRRLLRSRRLRALLPAELASVSGFRRPICNRERNPSSSSIIRGKTVITRALDRHQCEQIDDGAVLQRDGLIVAIGSFAELSRANPDTEVMGTGEQVLLPGFVNGHHHVGLTPVQLGSPDMPLELWFATRLVARDLDLYLDTLYSAFEMIAIQHHHGATYSWLDARQTGAGRRALRRPSSAPTKTSAYESRTASRCATREPSRL